MNDNFNKNLRDAFDQAEDDFNPAIIWQGINDKMKPAKKDKRRFILAWIFGLGAGILILSLYVNNISNGSEITNELIYENNEKIASTVDVDQSLSLSAKELTSNIQSEELTLQHDFSVVNSSETNAIASSKNVVDQEKAIRLVEKNKSTKLSQNSTIPNNNELRSYQSIKSNTPSINDIYTRNKTTPQASRIKLSVKELLVRKTDELSFNFSDDPVLNVNVFVAKKRLIEHIEMFSGMAFGTKINTSANSEYISSRNSTEQLLEQLTIGTRMQLIEYTDFTFWLGVKYSLVNDAWKVQYQYTEDLPFTYLEYTLENQVGDIEEIFVTKVLPYDVNRRIEQYNQEQIVSFPLEVRYQTKFNRWTLSPFVGVECNYLLGANHTVLGLDGLPMNELKIGQWIAPSFFGGIYSSYHISPNWKISTGLNYRVLNINNSVIVPDLNSRYNLYGFELGIAKKF